MPTLTLQDQPDRTLRYRLCETCEVILLTPEQERQHRDRGHRITWLQ